jgi:hypothetical protein
LLLHIERGVWRLPRGFVAPSPFPSGSSC